MYIRKPHNIRELVLNKVLSYQPYTTPTAKDICASVSPRLLVTTVSDIHLADVVSHFHEWEELAPYLDLTETDEEDIKTKYSNRPRLMGLDESVLFQT